MSKSEMEDLLVLSSELPIHEALFEQMPLWSVEIFLNCFDSEGQQRRGVPRHVLEALAKRFRSVMEGDIKSLDGAFGGKIRRQRNSIKDQALQYEVSYRMQRAMEVIANEPHSVKGAGTPYEIALERVARELRMGADNVHRIYKKAGSR